MAAATAIAAIGVVAGGVDLFMQRQNQKDAQKRAEDARLRMENVKEENPFKDLQTADVSGIANQEISQGEKDAIDAAQDMGEAGAAQITNIFKASTDARLKAEEKQEQEVVKRDLTEANAQSGINQREAQREAGLAALDLEQSQTEQQQAQANQVAAATGMFESGAAFATGLDEDLKDGKLFG